MRRYIGLAIVLVLLAGLIGWARFAGAQSPTIPPPNPDPPLPVPVLPGQPGLLVPVRIHPDQPAPASATPSPAQTREPPLAQPIVPVTVRSQQPVAEPPLAAPTGTALVSGAFTAPAEMGP